MENFRLNSRVASAEREYLIQTFNDPTQRRVRSSIFPRLLLDTVEEEFAQVFRSRNCWNWSEHSPGTQREIEHLLQKFAARCNQ
jgi:hypothetical protein